MSSCSGEGKTSVAGTFERADKADDGIRQRGFTDAVGAGHAVDLAGGYNEVEAAGQRGAGAAYRAVSEELHRRGLDRSMRQRGCSVRFR